MRLHSDKITYSDVYIAANYAARQAGHGDVFVTNCEHHGSRSRARSFDVVLEGDGSVNKRPPAHRDVDYSGTQFAATWESWGWFLSFLFRIDPDMHEWADADAAAFHARTAHQFEEES